MMIPVFQASQHRDGLARGLGRWVMAVAIMMVGAVLAHALWLRPFEEARAAARRGAILERDHRPDTVIVCSHGLCDGGKAIDTAVAQANPLDRSR